MLKKAQIDTQAWDTADKNAVTVLGVTKTFTQWQRENEGRGIIKNLLKPEKKVIVALDDVSFNVKRGEFIAYAGPNGAGKSTTMKLLCGMLLPECGEIKVLGMSPKDNRIPLMKRLGVLFGNRTELWWDHPISQSFEWKRAVWDIPDEVYKRNLEMVTELLNIGDLLKTFARELSLGQRMRADLALMLLHSPSIILLDEPTLGLDVIAKRQMIEFLKRLNKDEKVTIMVTSHDMDDLEEMAQRILMVSSGKVVYDGSFDGLRDITGNVTRIVVTATEDTVLSIDGGQHISADNGVFEFEVDLAKVSVKDVLYRISQADGVKDVAIGKASIEKVIAELYHSWRSDNA